ncbi:protein farnesyltransferase/geranylgeranyltransferase type-1 subunit alpha [Nematocida major]|uniref:protein farnesyltransferase/geranylgeranyltransferase type-1 subunit alpha n=1 Tax=Nematocida major TaxID=1912982 RepID=UPI002008AF02|nr:protein farnesyltransferase/geranylgeranyltransferase type-1 subunit alpha [Nematocida major]KAH9386727.1 protein farnesyltransferase/geranylgeranyltransferase type-1 subunit alpha [Nematocida major]
MNKENAEIRIKYPSDYVVLMEKHIEAMKAEKYTIDALHRTSTLLFHFPTNYTVWVDRRKILLGLPEAEYTLQDELAWIKAKAADNQKNYQVWHHFKFVLRKTSHEISTDLEILELVKEEPKNIHFWGVFLACTQDVPSALEYTKYFIEVDVRNNSPFSIRHTLIMPLLKESADAVEKERAFLLGLPILKRNDAYWNYVNAMDREFPEHAILQECEAHLKSKEATVRCGE